jgi:hypothetical protein
MTQVDGAEEAELRRLLVRHDEGRLKPAEVELGEMPASATGDMRRLAEDVCLLIGLRLAVGQDEPLPYATSFAIERMGWDDRTRASRAFRKLCDAEVVRHVGAMPPRAGKKHGTKMYAAPLVAGAGAVEGEPVGVEAVDVRAEVQPAGEVGDEQLVGHAVGGSGDGTLPQLGRPDEAAVEREVASGDAAGTVHAATDGNDATGGGDPSVPCPDPLCCRYRWRHAAGPWTCEFNHPMRPRVSVRSRHISAPARQEPPGAWPNRKEP